jgi:hydrogenase maturation factor
MISKKSQTKIVPEDFQKKAIYFGIGIHTNSSSTSLEIINTTTGVGNASTLSMRQSTQNTTSGNVLSNINFVFFSLEGSTLCSHKHQRILLLINYALFIPMASNSAFDLRTNSS